MSKKTTTYLLIAGVLLIWGIIIYRIIIGLNSEKEYLIITTVPGKKEVYDDYEFKRDSGKLALNYRDPFSVSEFNDTIKKSNNLPAGKASGRVNLALPDWSTIRYFGYIANPKSHKVISMVSVNGKNLTLADGERDHEFELIKNMRDSVLVRYKLRTGYISRN